MLIKCQMQRINTCIIFLRQFQKLISAAYNVIDGLHRTNGICAPHAKSIPKKLLFCFLIMFI